MLYRNRLFAVTLALKIVASVSLLAAQGPVVQYGGKVTVDKGPRALGLVQLSPKGTKGRLIPIAIMLDGKFFDAGSYKAAPVPMALDFGTVYEGFRSGVSQGLFTITQPGQLNHVWIAEGTWLPAGAPDPSKHKKYSTPVIADEDKDSPPVLHRRSEKKDSDSSTRSDSGKDSSDNNKTQQKPPAPAAPPTPAPASPPTAPDNTKAQTVPDTAKTAPSESAKAPADEPNEDPNRPRLRRGKPDAAAHRDLYTTFDPSPDATPAAAPDAKAAKDAAAVPPQPIFIPAISDTGGPDPRPYTYDLKPAEEAIYRNKMLDLAAAQLRAHLGSAKEAASAPKKPASTKSASKLPKPSFEDVSLKIFDLSNSNEPVLVLSAKTARPAANAAGSQEPKEITLIARTNLEGEIQKLFFSETDSQHLDLTPRMELVDAVDADGDGRGELLFRRTFDSGSAYAIYRVTADGLWTLFEGTP
ncbi:MAG: hypothetical protein WAM89_03290 [Terriglobales bacterium]